MVITATGNGFVEDAEHQTFYAEKIKVITKFCSAAMSEQPIPYYNIGAADHSPDHKLFAVTEDRQGSERYALTIFRAGSHEPIETPLTDCRGDFEWSTDSHKLVYTRLDENQRPNTVWCHIVGTKQADDQLIYQLEHPGRFIGLGKTALLPGLR